MADDHLETLLATQVLTIDDIYLQGSTLATFLCLAVFFTLSGQLNDEVQGLCRGTTGLDARWRFQTGVPAPEGIRVVLCQQLFFDTDGAGRQPERYFYCQQLSDPG